MAGFRVKLTAAQSARATTAAVLAHRLAALAPHQVGADSRIGLVWSQLQLLALDPARLTAAAADEALRSALRATAEYTADRNPDPDAREAYRLMPGLEAALAATDALDFLPASA